TRSRSRTNPRPNEAGSAACSTRAAALSAKATGPAATAARQTPKDEIDVSVIMPCLNEDGAVGQCVGRAREWIERSGLRGEVIVVDNGSTDRSVELATRAGA